MKKQHPLKIIWNLISNTFISTIRSRFFSLFAIFSFVLLYASVLGSMLSISHEERVLADISLLLIELLCFVYAVFQVSTTFSDEIRNKNIYLVLSRPVPRHICLIGKELGVVLSVAFITLILSIMSAIVIKTRGLNIPPFFFWAAAGSFIKISILVFFAFLLSLVSSTNITAFLMSTLLYVLGHVTSQLGPLMQKAKGIKFLLLKTCAIVFPNLNLYSAREFATDGCPFTAMSLTAALLWIAAAYILAAWLFSRKEF